MWPSSVGIYNRSGEDVVIELYVGDVDAAAEVFPLLINRFDKDYRDFASRNISPLKIDTVNGRLKTTYRLAPGECLNIGKYWDDEYRGYLNYHTPTAGRNPNHMNKIQFITVRHPRITISGSPEHLDGLVKPLNTNKKIWGLVIE